MISRFILNLIWLSKYILIIFNMKVKLFFAPNCWGEQDISHFSEVATPLSQNTKNLKWIGLVWLRSSIFGQPYLGGRPAKEQSHGKKDLTFHLTHLYPPLHLVTKPNSIYIMQWLHLQRNAK